MKRARTNPHAEALIVLERSGEWATEVVAAAVPAAEPNRPCRGLRQLQRKRRSAPPGRPMIIHLYIGHDRKTERRGPHTLRLSDQIRARYVQGLDLHADETLFWMTDMGWMMGPVGSFRHLAARRDHDALRRPPDFPGPIAFGNWCADHRVTALGIRRP